MKNIIITGSGGVASIGFTRCLKKSPEKVFLIGTDCDKMLINFSETNKKILVPPAKNPEYIEIINDITTKNNIDFIHAQPDVEISVLSENRNKLSASTFLPNDRTIKICHDKFQSTKIWVERGVPTGKVIFIRNRNDLKKAFEVFGSSLWVRAIKGTGGKGSLLVNKYNHAEMWIDYCNGWGNFIANEYLPGANFGFDGIFKDGELIASFCKQRLKYALQKASPSGITGTASVIKVINREDVKDVALKAIHAIDKNPNGILSVDLKENKNGIPCVTEINPGRFLTSSLHFFDVGNYNLPYVYIKIAYKERTDLKLKNLKTSELLMRSLDTAPKIIDENIINKIEVEKKWIEM